MLTECPSCRTPYAIDEALLSRRGRRIRCQICDHRWLQCPSAAPEISVAEEAQTPSQELAEASQINVEQRPNQPQPSWRPQIALPDVRDRAAAIWAVLPAAPSARALWRPAAIAAALVIPMLIIGQRARIVRHVPGAAPVFAGIGLPVNLRGLEFRQVTSTLFDDDGQRTLAVEGVIAQVGHDPSKVPAVQIAVRDATGRDLYTWTAPAPRPKLAPGEEVLFRARLASPPHAGAQIHLQFADADPTHSATRSPH